MVVEFEIAQALLGGRHDVVVREDFRDRRAGLRRPDAVLGRHFGGDVDLAARFADDLADELFAMAIAVGERGVDQVDAQFDGARRASTDSSSVPPSHCFPPMPQAP